MYIATIIPIARGIPFDTLTYYAASDLAVGTLVTIPFGKQTISGIVVECCTLAQAKTFIKQAAFSLKKIKSVIGTVAYFGIVAQALQESSMRTLAPIGAIAAHVIPHALFEYIATEKIPELLISSDSSHFFEEDAISGTTNDRSDYYKRLIRSAFAAKKSVLFIAPSIRALEYWKEQLQKGIQKHVVLFHSKVTKKDLRSAFALLKQQDIPLVVFATPGFMILPRADIGYIIAEEESSNLYKGSDRFMIDTRVFVRELSQKAGFKLYWGDTIPRFETLARVAKDHLPRAFVPDKLTVVPVEPYRSILPTEVIETIRHAQKKKERIYIYATRKGVAPLSRCSDCGTIVTCPTCELPVVLRNRITSEGKERTFICTHCGDTLPATHVCSYCASWNITPVSIGTESIRDAVVSLVDESCVITIDDDLTPDSAQIKTLLDTADKQKFLVVIGTTKALPYIKNIQYVLFPFFDRQLSTPALSTTENALRIVMECNERAHEGVLVFTRQPDFPFIRQIQTQKINDIIADELALRKDLGYPPYGSLIKVSLTVPEGYKQKIIDAINLYTTGLETTALPPRRISPGSMKVLLVWILKVPTTYIENDGRELASFLETLHFPYLIEENPDRL